MKTLLAVLAAAAALTGCVAVPLEPAPVVYAAPPAVVVRPVPYYGHYHYYGGGRYGYGRRWR